MKKVLGSIALLVLTSCASREEVLLAQEEQLGVELCGCYGELNFESASQCEAALEPYRLTPLEAACLGEVADRNQDAAALVDCLIEASARHVACYDRVNEACMLDALRTCAAAARDRYEGCAAYWTQDAVDASTPECLETFAERSRSPS